MTYRFSRETLRTVRQVPLFAGLGDETLALLGRGAHERCCPRGTRLFAQGEPADRFYVVLDGWVKLYRDSPDGSECLVGLFSRGESFAEAAMFDRQGFPVNASVAEDARLMVFPAEPFLDTLLEHRALTLNLLANLTGMLRALVLQLDQLTNQSTHQRLAAFLLSLCPDGAAHATVCLPCDKMLIAARLGMKPESFSRAMARLRGLGVRCERNCVHLEDLPALRLFARGGETRPQPACPGLNGAGCGSPLSSRPMT
ncbi:Crp/Fnr family transcriptional regulator [Halomonas sp. BM-2019]|uniref:Crp/Fnr family transcriptional regulator n=1 Tax=Halomonas sp. BM-2019 TaxID=2811227 RepID=UPI001B3C3E84|nr:MAG: Crp/Fnr family transcriptional regulator [Halomonas sp. BM-2019]